MNRKEIAINHHQMDGYNCAQAVIVTYCDLVDLDPVTAFKISEGFGLGMGRMQGVCGALSGAIMIVSMHLSSGEIQSDGTRTKAATYKIVAKMVQDFNDKSGALLCKDLKDPKSPHFTPCDTSIANACDLLDEYFSHC